MVAEHYAYMIEDAKCPNRGLQNVWGQLTNYNVIKNEKLPRTGPSITRNDLSKELREAYFQLNSGTFSNPLPTKIGPDSLSSRIEMTQQSLRDGTNLDLMNSLKGHVEAHAIMGEDDSVHKRLSDKFALNAMGEIVCGKVTPMTDAEAMASPDCNWNGNVTCRSSWGVSPGPVSHRSHPLGDG